MKKKRYRVRNTESRYGDIHIYFRDKVKASISPGKDCYFLSDDHVKGSTSLDQRRTWFTLKELLAHLTKKWRIQQNSKGRFDDYEIVFDLSGFRDDHPRSEATAKDIESLVSEPAV